MGKNPIKILDVKFNPYFTKEALNQIAAFIGQNKRGYIVTPNPEFLITAQKNSEFKNILNRADLSIPDGIGILWAAKFLSLKTSRLRLLKHLHAVFQLLYSGLSLIFYPRYCRTIIPERVAGSDLINNIFQLARNQKLKLYLLGAQPGIARQAAQIIQNKYPGIEIAGTQSGSPDKEYDNEICYVINKAKPDIIMIAYGAPKQELWINRNLSKLATAKVAIGVGGALDFITGKIKRAPGWMRYLGLEWLYRLIKEPRRIKRIINATIYFPYLVLKNKLTNL